MLEGAGAGLRGLSGGICVLTEVGPVTLTTDPQLFQQRLRELHVQVGIPSPQPWHCLLVGSGAIPASPTSVMGAQAEPAWLGGAHRAGSGEDG